MKKHFILAHKFCFKNKKLLEKSKICGCFYCLKIYEPSLIKEWVKENDREFSAICPNCGIDAVIGDKSGYHITKNLLKEMNKYWFGRNIRASKK